MKKIGLFLMFILLQLLAIAQQHGLGQWQYIYPFKDRHLVLAIQFGGATDGEKLTGTAGQNAMVYFVNTKNKLPIVYWKTTAYLSKSKVEVDWVDYNHDGTKDLLLFTHTGARAANAFYQLYLVDAKKKQLHKVKGFEELPNPSYQQKHKAILSYAVAGSSYYSLYRLSKTNTLIPIGTAFEDTDSLDLDQKLDELLWHQP